MPWDNRRSHSIKGAKRKLTRLCWTFPPFGRRNCTKTFQRPLWPGRQLRMPRLPLARWPKRAQTSSSMTTREDEATLSSAGDGGGGGSAEAAAADFLGLPIYRVPLYVVRWENLARGDAKTLVKYLAKHFGTVSKNQKASTKQMGAPKRAAGKSRRSGGYGIG